MVIRNFFWAAFTSVVWLLLLAALARAQSNSGTIAGIVLDPSGGVVIKATVEIHNPVSGYDHTATTDDNGNFKFTNIPFNPYHMTVKANGFAPYAQDVDVRSSVPMSLSISLEIAVTSSTVTVEGGGDLVENDSTYHTDVDRDLIEKLPLESQSSSLSSLVTLSSPGITADSNGLFHGLGDHAENSFSVDGQPITDQQSKVFSNQVPVDSIQSIEVISGAPPAEYGDKTSVVVVATTRSGLGATTPHGSINASYGSFGSSNAGFDLSYGGQKWGNFISLNGMNTGRFLDPPEFVVMHDKGNEENAFDRVDFQLSPANSLHLNLGYSRSWFQTPNSFDAQNATAWNGVVVSNGGLDPNGNVVGPTDQRSKIGTYNIAPSFTHLISNATVFTLGGFARHDQYNYYPSGNPFADLGPPSLQRETIAQSRKLTNVGALSNVSHVKGMHNIKAGITYEQTFLNEGDSLAIVDPTFNAPCLNATTNIPVEGPFGVSNPSQCSALGLLPNVVCTAVLLPPACDPNAPASAQYPAFNSVLFPFDMSRGGTLFGFHGHTDVKELSMYVQDTITWRDWSFNVGVRGDIYNGLTKAQQAEPRIGISYNIKKTSSVLRLSYARTLETPFNENLVLSSIGCNSDVLSPLLGCSAGSVTPISPGFRNEFHAGLQQAFGRYVVFDGEYIWKYTHNAYDFSVLGNTPITFPIEWHSSKIPGYAFRVNVPNYHGLSAYSVMSSVAARFFTPQVGGAGAVPAAPLGVFRIDHDERFNQTTHAQYQPRKNWPWIGFSWRYDSGVVAGATPCFFIGNPSCPGSMLVGGVPTISLVASNVGAVPLSPDQQFQAGFFCGNFHATPTQGIPGGTCPASQFGSKLINVPSPNTENDDKNPPRISSRNLFDMAVGDDNLFHGDRYKWSLRLTAVNMTNEYALYNFLSTFSGTHYVTPRTYTAELGFHF